MIRPLVLAALLSGLPAALPAQLPASPRERQLAPICDGSEMRRLERRRQTGGRLALGTLAGNALVFGLSLGSSNPESAPRAIENGRRAMTFAIATMPLIVLGAHMHASAYPDDAFWARALARMNVGETTSADVRACLAQPSATSSSGAEEKWTYFTSASHGWLSRRSLATMSFTFRNGVLTEVRRSEVNLSRVWSESEAVRVVVPVP
jgi:hypothetical protein